MTVEDTDQVDFISLDEASGDVVLTVSDHLDWNDVHGHLAALRRKVARYAAFVEAGEVEDHLPNASNRQVRIEVFAKFPMPQLGRLLLEELDRTFGFRIELRVVDK